MASLTELREALAANLAGIAGLQESAYVLTNPTPPAAEILPSEIDYDQTFARGLDRWRFTVRVFVGYTSDIGSQKRLDRMLASSGTDSVKDALQSDRTLGGIARDVYVSRSTGYRVFKRQGAPDVLGAEWQCDVYARGDT